MSDSNQRKIGSVMVVGAGIAGMQASLDLANSGFKVYLVDESTSIGGRMAQLDKTFPTNDCSMCTISPKLIECDKHLNIDIVTNARVEDVQGDAGNFKVTVLKRPRFIDVEKCNACGDCIEVCPVDVFAEFEEGLTDRKAIYKNFPQAIPSAYAIDKKGTSPCKATCPAHIHVQGYIALIAKGRYEEALALIKKDNPLPAICGRVCHHPCEAKCTRGKVDEPVAIDFLKRFVADIELTSKERKLPEIEEKREDRIAIIGSGPAGLTSAYYLALKGYNVTVFESLPVAGGMLAVGIPEYRLPKDILNAEIDYIRELGVEIRTNTRIGVDLTIQDLKQEGYKAIFLAVGSHISRKLGIEGEDLQGVVHGVHFLRDINLGKKVSLGKKVAVIGGGNVAIDSVRTALRLGAEEAFIIYRRSIEEMPANEEEIEEAEEEGIKIHYLVAPVRILGKDGRVVGLECIRMKLGEPDGSGRRRPIPIEDSGFVMDVDAVIPAIGQSLDTAFMSPEIGLKLNKGDTIEIDSVTYATNIPGIFAGGDAASGPATVIEAIAAGKEAAVSIDRYLKGEDLHEGRGDVREEIEVDTHGIERSARQRMPRLNVKERIDSFNEVQLGFSESQALEEANRCLNCGICSECLRCVEACTAKAINHQMNEELVDIGVGSIILTPGYEEFHADIKGEYGYGRMKNVVTSLEFERILSASGPYHGHVLRPSDQATPKKIAWIQCVGSRDASCGKEYCSSVCCMYATKEAIMAIDHVEGLEATVFYNDIRAFGKGFESYYETAKKKYGVRYIKSIVSSVKELQKTNGLFVKYTTDDDQIKEEEFDMVVLSVGLVPSPGTRELAEKISVQLNQYGFCETKTLAPNVTSRPGVYVAGAFEAPMDIPEAVMTASSAACLSSELLSGERGSMVKEKTYPPEREIASEEGRVGVFVCRCGTNIARVVDVPEVAEYAKTLPGVVHAEENLFTCSTDTTSNMIDIIKKKGINRVVVASCTPRTHEPLFQDTLREAGLNKYLFEMANIRDQCSWVHANHPAEATEKAKDLIRMAVSRANTLEPLQELPFNVIPRGLVVGGGVTGMTAALSLASQGYETYLVEKTSELGGNARDLHYTLDGMEPSKHVEYLIQQVENQDRIKVFKDSHIVEFSGHVGNFKTRVSTGGALNELEHGVVIIATGGIEYRPTEYLYGQDERVLTQRELEKKTVTSKEEFKDIKDVVMIQCVGSREDAHQFCSRVCCTEAVKNAIKLKEINPDINVYVLYRDIRTYAFKELYYKKAREAGVVFIRYDADRKPKVTSSNGQLELEVFDETLGAEITLKPDCLVLSAGIHPRPDAPDLATTFKLPLNMDGYFLEAHMKLRPLDFSNDGIYLCGLAHSPKFIEESISQARGAVARACTVLSKDQMYVSGMISVVDQERCAACLTCVRVCPFDVPSINEAGVAVIEAASCQGCGICASACPRKAISLQNYKDDQVVAKCAVLC